METERLDIRKRRKSKEKFIGFLTNPVYTQAGVEEFVGFGIRQLSDKGARVFLEVGDESIGKRFLFLQEFFSKNNLVIDEIIKRKISYPYIMLYKEDKEILRRFTSLIEEGIIKRYPKLAASLYIFRYIPKRPKKLKRKGEFYAYL
ncbi:MAG TPA: putative methyltransferase [bacterium]|nr:putative methyltransferase [bacterium]